MRCVDLEWEMGDLILYSRRERNFVERANLLNRPLRTRMMGGVGAGG